MIDTKSNIRLASSAPSELPKSSNEDNAPIDVADGAIRNRAYELYELGGRVDGRGTGLVPGRNRCESRQAIRAREHKRTSEAWEGNASSEAQPLVESQQL